MATKGNLIPRIKRSLGRLNLPVAEGFFTCFAAEAAVFHPWESLSVSGLRGISSELTLHRRKATNRELMFTFQSVGGDNEAPPALWLKAEWFPYCGLDRTGREVLPETGKFIRTVEGKRGESAETSTSLGLPIEGVTSIRHFHPPFRER